MSGQDADGRCFSYRLAGEEFAPLEPLDPFQNNDLSRLLSTLSNEQATSQVNQNTTNSHFIDLLDDNDNSSMDAVQDTSPIPTLNLYGSASTHSSNTRFTNHSIHIDSIERTIDILQQQLERVAELPNDINATITTAIANALNTGNHQSQTTNQQPITTNNNIQTASSALTYTQSNNHQTQSPTSNHPAP